MKAVTFALVAGFTLATGAASASAEGLYAGGQIGFGGNGGETVGDGTIVSGFVGTHFGNHGRIEAELAYRQNDLAVNGFTVNGEISSLALMGNAFYDFGDGAGFTPYLGIGIGMASTTLDSTFYNTNDTSSAFAFQLMAGASFPVGESLSMTVDARSYATAPTMTNNTGNDILLGRYWVNSLMLGLRKNF